MVLSMNAVPRSSRHSSAATVVDPNVARRASHARLLRRQAFLDQLHRLALDVELTARRAGRARHDAGMSSARARNVKSRRFMRLRQFHDAADRVLHPVPLMRFDR